MTLKLFQSKFNYVIFTQRYISSSRGQNHYDALKLPHNCTKKQIKESFIKLSKQHHPDKNACKKSHAEFLKIREAYNVLSKSDTRRMYDMSISDTIPPHTSNFTNVYYTRTDPYADPSFYHNRTGRMEREQGYSDDYYGLGIKRQPNYLIAGLCVLVAAFAFAIQMFFISQSFTFKRDVLMQRSLENENTLRQLKQQAEENGHEKQVELLKERLAKQR